MSQRYFAARRSYRSSRPGQRHREHITGAADPLPGGRPDQVVVAVPARLRSRIRDQLEDRPRPGHDLTAGADHAWPLLLSCHPPIQAPRQAVQEAQVEELGSVADLGGRPVIAVIRSRRSGTDVRGPVTWSVGVTFKRTVRGHETCTSLLRIAEKLESEHAQRISGVDVQIAGRRAIFLI